MSDGNSILGAVADAGKDLVKETGNQTVKAAVGIAKAAGQQIVGQKTDEELQKEKADQIATFQRIKEIEAEMAQIRAQKEQKYQQAQQQSDAPTTPSSLDNFADKKPKPLDEASRQAVGKAEQGRNFKG